MHRPVTTGALFQTRASNATWSSADISENQNCHSAAARFSGRPATMTSGMMSF